MSVIINQNRKMAFCIGILSTIGGWYALILMTQKKVQIKERHYIGLLLATIGYVIWFFEFCYTFIPSLSHQYLSPFICVFLNPKSNCSIIKTLSSIGNYIFVIHINSLIV